MEGMWKSFECIFGETKLNVEWYVLKCRIPYQGQIINWIIEISCHSSKEPQEPFSGLLLRKEQQLQYVAREGLLVVE